MARENLQRANVTNVEVREGDGAQGLPAEAPFDAILLSGSVAQVPHALLEQLKVGGRLLAIVGDEPVMRATLVTRTGDAGFTTTQPWDTVAPRLANFPEPSRFKF
jgi:protein-L-isoaspartate(D-aspartate) O-methyltransferase